MKSLSSLMLKSLLLEFLYLFLSLWEFLLQLSFFPFIYSFPLFDLLSDALKVFDFLKLSLLSDYFTSSNSDSDSSKELIWDEFKLLSSLYQYYREVKVNTFSCINAFLPKLLQYTTSVNFSTIVYCLQINLFVPLIASFLFA